MLIPSLSSLITDSCYSTMQEYCVIYFCLIRGILIQLAMATAKYGTYRPISDGMYWKKRYIISLPHPTPHSTQHTHTHTLLILFMPKADITAPPVAHK